MRSRDPKKVAVLAYDGLGTFEFGIVVEVFGLPRTGLGVAWYDFRVCSMNRKPLRAAGGITVQTRHGLAALDRAGTIVIPGWKLDGPKPPARLIDSLRRAHAAGARLVSICSGVFLLAASGILDGKRATAHWRHADRFRARYPHVRVDPAVLYTQEGNIFTSAGSAAGLDLCLHIVRLDFGAEIANQLARRLVIPPHREGGQAQFIEDPIQPENAGSLAKLLEWARKNLRHALTVEDLAKAACMSPRTLARQFLQQTGTTPHRWLTHQRLLEAQRRLEKTEESIDQIAAAVGMDSAGTLRFHFRTVLGTSPSAYRRRFALPRTA